MLKFKSWKGRDKWLFLLTIGVILCILAFPTQNLLPKTKTAGGGAQTGEAAGASGKTGGDAWDLGGEGGTPDGSGVSAAASSVQASAGKGNGSYEAELERRVREILKTVDGVGEVDVMIVLKSSAEKVIHVDSSTSRSATQEKDTGGGERKIDSEERDANTVLTTGDGQNSPIIEKELRPELSGIIISAAGGGSPTVRAEISAAMEALFDLPAHKIKVLKRVE